METQNIGNRSQSSILVIMLGILIAFICFSFMFLSSTPFSLKKDVNSPMEMIYMGTSVDASIESLYNYYKEGVEKSEEQGREFYLGYVPKAQNVFSIESENIITFE
jgi:hypothetical protein